MTETTDIAALLYELEHGDPCDETDIAALLVIQAQAARITKLEADCRTWQKTFDTIEIEAKNDAARIEVLTGALTDIRQELVSWRGSQVDKLNSIIDAALAQTPKGKADD